LAAKFIDPDRWGSAADGQTSKITLVRNQNQCAQSIESCTVRTPFIDIQDRDS
jgi:hypothetical protein